MPLFTADGSGNEITVEDRRKIVANVKKLFFLASANLGVPRSVPIQVRWGEITQLPKPNVKLLFEAQVHAEHDVCGGICRGAVMSDSSHGWIDSQPKRIYGSI